MLKQIFLFLAAMLLLCLAPMPYGYFMLVRFVMMVAFGWMAYQYYLRQKTMAMWLFVSLSLLFQPFFKIALGRLIWNIVDVLVAVLLVVLYVLERQWEKKSSKEPLPPPSNVEIEMVDNKFDFTLEGRLAPKELVYVASEEDKELMDFFEKNPEVLEGWGKMNGYHIIIFPLLLKHLQSKEVLQYRAPYLTDIELERLEIGNDFFLQYLQNPSDKERMKHGFIRTEDIRRGADGNDKAINRFYPVSSNSTEPIADQLHRIGRQMTREQTEYECLIDNITYDDWGEPDYRGADDRFNSQIEGEDTNDLLEEIKEKIAKLRQRGIAEHVLEELLHPDDRLSKLVVTRDHRIVLPDYNNMEIKMEPLVKAVYLLFLKHPEGLIFKHLPDYREELVGIYVNLKPNGLGEKALQSIEDVTNPFLNSINEKCARIRGAFVGQFDNHLARHYYIDGLRGEAKKISLPRELVVWE